jgi:hypothetical protein
MMDAPRLNRSDSVDSAGQAIQKGTIYAVTIELRPNLSYIMYMRQCRN